MTKRTISLCSLLLFVIPVVTLLICHQIVMYYYDFHTIPFIDGKASISQMGRGEKTIVIFRSGFFLYALVSIYFYFEISKFFLSKGFKNKLKALSISANLFLLIYLFALGKDQIFFEICRRLAIIFYIVNMYINHFYMIRILRYLKFKKKIQLNIIYLIVFYTVIFLMTILVIIGLPWVNPLFKYPTQLKNIVEWNYLFLTIIFYIPVSFMFYQFRKNVKSGHI